MQKGWNKKINFHINRFNKLKKLRWVLSYKIIKNLAIPNEIAKKLID